MAGSVGSSPLERDPHVPHLPPEHPPAVPPGPSASSDSQRSLASTTAEGSASVASLAPEEGLRRSLDGVEAGAEGAAPSLLHTLRQCFTIDTGVSEASPEMVRSLHTQVARACVGQ